MLRGIGGFLQRRQDVVRRVQWGVVAVYLALLLVPVLVPQAFVLGGGARITEAVFWGIWWPVAIFATLLCGQFWCGLLCPDGTVTEFLSRHGRAGKISLRMRWPGWPLLLFTFITLAWHFFDARRVPAATLALLGGGSLAAWATGHYLGRGKRLWCRYLCPAGSVFSLLSRAAMLHFRVDRDKWDAAPRPLPRPVDCPQLLDVRRLNGNAECSMCARCSGHRAAVTLALRVPGAEIAALREEEANPRDAFAICFVLIGLGYGIARDGTSMAEMLLTAAGLGGGVAVLLWLGAAGHLSRAVLMAHGLIPLAGAGLLFGALGRSEQIMSTLGLEMSGWLAAARNGVLLAGAVWSIGVGRAMARNAGSSDPRRGLHGAIAYISAVVLVLVCYFLGCP